MALKLVDKWVWDSWFAFDGENFHVFYLQASRALGDPNRRHRNVTVGHAISPDLTNWTQLVDALTPSESPAADSWTTWTGSVVWDEATGAWRMFYTGTSREDAGERQTVCMAVSTDLMVWEKVDGNPIVVADRRWYQTLEAGFTNEPFRDPWVFKLPGQSEWTMLTTAADVNAADQRQRGLMGVAKSADLVAWEVQPPAGSAGQGFGETEVFQFEIVDGVPILLFCCGPIWLSEERKKAGELGGVYSLPVAPDLSDVDFNRATLFPDTSLYASRLIQGKDGGWNLIAFVNEVNGEFVGELSNPVPVTADPMLGLVPKNG